MIRKLLTTTALAALLATGAVAQDATTTTTPADPNAAVVTDGMNDLPTAFEMGQGYSYVDTDNLATRILGQPIYTGTAADADNIGDVNDLVVTSDGSVSAVIIGVGGFLGIGEKNVAVPFSALEWTVAADNTERWTVATTREALEAAPAFEVIEDEPADMAMTPADTTTAPADTAMAPSDTTTTAETPMAADPMAATPDANAMTTENGAMTETMVDRTALSNLDATTLTAEELIGTRVVGPDDEQIAEVGDLVLTAEGQIDAVLVDFGGFLGIGEKRVAVAMDNLEFATDSDGNRYVFLPGVTREQLDAAPAYNADTYATDTTQRMTVGM